MPLITVSLQLRELRRQVCLFRIKKRYAHEGSCSLLSVCISVYFSSLALNYAIQLEVTIVKKNMKRKSIVAVVACI